VITISTLVKPSPAILPKRTSAAFTSSSRRLGLASVRDGPPKKSILRKEKLHNNNPANANNLSTTSSKRSLRTATNPKTGTSGQRRKATLAHEGNTASTAQATSATAANHNFRKGFTDSLSDFLGKPRTIPVPRWVTPKHYSITLSECAGHASFILVGISYALDDFLWLRIIAVAGSTSMLFFTYFHPHGRVLWLPFKWNCLFIAINSYRIGRVFLDRHWAQKLSKELEETRDKHFYLMDRVDFAKLARSGTIESYKKGDVVVVQGQPNAYVRVVLSGGLKVLRDGGLTYTLDEGNFMSESGLHAGLMLVDKVDSCCTIVAESDVRLLTWNRTDLMELLHEEPHLRRSIKAILTWDIVRKLKGQRLMMGDHVIEDTEAWNNRRHDQTVHRYTAILKNLLASNPINFEQRKKELNKYRTIHHIDDEDHRESLKECGWTEEEFAAGHKDNYPTEIPTKLHSPGWYLREWFSMINNPAPGD